MIYKYLIRCFLLINFWFLSSIVHPLKASDSDSITLSLLTCAPGHDLHTLFGHSALRLKDNQGLDIVFNYGTFDFEAPGFALKFVRGKLPYRLAVGRYSSFMREYKYTQRSVKEQIIHLDSVETQRIVKFLKNNAKPENAFYAYDFLFDNCSTRIRDIINNELSDISINYSDNQEISYRQQLIPYMKDKVWITLGIHLILSGVTDEISNFQNQMFLPDYLHDHLSKINKKNKPLLAPTQELMSFIPTRDITPWYAHPNFIFSFILLFIIICILAKQNTLYKILSKSILTFAGILGLVYLFMWFATDHQSTYSNWNLLWLNPLYFLVLFKIRTLRSYLLKVLILFNLIALVNIFIPIVPQYFDPLFLLPLSIVLIILLKELNLPDQLIKEK